MTVLEHIAEVICIRIQMY